LTLLALANMLIAIMSRRNYTADVITALLLALLVHSAAVTAIATEWWAQPQETDESRSRQGMLGEVAIHPCCLPFYSLPGLYMLRRKPEVFVPEGMREIRQRLAELAQVGQEVARRHSQLELTLERERTAARAQEAEIPAMVQREVSTRLCEEKRRLEAEEKRILAEAKQRLKEGRRRASIG